MPRAGEKSQKLKICGFCRGPSALFWQLHSNAYLTQIHMHTHNLKVKNIFEEKKLAVK